MYAWSISNQTSGTRNQRAGGGGGSDSRRRQTVNCWLGELWKEININVYVCLQNEKLFGDPKT